MAETSSGAGSASAAGPAVSGAVTDTSGVVLGVDVGGSGIKGAPVDVATGELVEDRNRIPTPQPATPGAVAETVAEVVSSFDSVDGPVGVTLPAVIRGGQVRTAANIDEAWIGTDAAGLISDATGRPTTVLNDADAAGLAEIRHGAGAGHRGVVVVLTLGTGIGSALFVDGRLVPNTELGHLHLHGGDAEDYAASSVRENEDLSWKHYAHRLEKYFRLVESLIWPDLIIVGGGVSKKSEHYLPRIEIETEVVPAALHNNAGIVGAAMAAVAASS